MKKKSVRRKINKKTAKKAHGFLSYKRFFLIIGCFLLFITGVINFYQRLKTLPCGNSISCIDDLSGSISSDKEGVFLGQKVKAPNENYFAENPTSKQTNVLGVATGGTKKIFVDLSQQELYAFDGNTLVYNFPVSTGKWGPTPTGTFTIWIKLEATRMTGGEGATYYDLPNVPWTMFFYNDQVPKSAGYSVHGAYWHNNFGYPMSHGCVNVRPDQAKLLYDWANPQTQGQTTYATAENPGTQVVIYGAPPQDEIAY